MPAPLVGAAALAAARLLAAQLAKQGTKQGVKKVSQKVARAIATEAAGKKAKAPFGTYRKPARSNKPRLRDTDNTPKKTTVRQQVGPKTKSGKFSEKKYTKTNTQPPVKKPAQPKTETPRVVKVRGRVVAINKPAANPKVRKREEAQLRISRREFAAERQRQAKLAQRREGGKPDTTTKTEVGIYSKSGTKYSVKVPKSSAGKVEELRPAQPTIESRLVARSESLPLTSRNQAGTDRMPPSEWRNYAKVRREASAAEAGKGTPVSKETIARGRARALTPTAERRAATIKATQQRAVAKAKARGMTDAQIKQIIERARREAAAIAKKAK